MDIKLVEWRAELPLLITIRGTHILQRAISCSEEASLRKHDGDYVLVIFRGLLGYSGDDMNKVSI